jgi:nucleolar protein 4
MKRKKKKKKHQVSYDFSFQYYLLHFYSEIKTDESSRDVREHRTLFIRNVPFDATEDDLSNILSSNGQRRIISCRLVIDPISKHPRGSAFVQFATSNDAEECLNLPFILHGQELQIDMALGRNELVKAKEIRDKKKENNKKPDQRNLSLANYGVILNLSELDGNENDLRKRQKLEDVKKQKLKNPSYFISPTRLTIHNLPVNIDDEKLRKIIIQTLKDNNIPMKDIILNECRVMKKTKESKKSLG